MKKLLGLLLCGIVSLSTYVDAESLSIFTAGREGPTSASHSFTTQSTTRSVKVTYQFVTSEVPAGFFGSQYNDYYSVAIQSPGSNVSDASSMNSLGRGAFNTVGATSDRSITLSVEGGSVVQVIGTVSNVGDGAYDSRLIIDSIEEIAINIESVALQDIDGSTLQYFSGDTHAYFATHTPIRGTIKIAGPEDVTILSIELNLIQGGGIVATGELHPESAALLTAFGSDEIIELTESSFMFNVPSTNGVSTTVDGSVNLQMLVTSDNGDEILHDIGSVSVLDWFDGDNRYGGRDAGVGGDSWALPSVVSFAGNFPSHSFGDFSNMHGGRFAPHASHRSGNDLDGWFLGYNARNAGTAATLIAILNGAQGGQIERVFVTFTQAENDLFWTAIENVTLNDGRAATSVIRSVGGHTGHYHWRIQ
jgi:hypothetical protein